MRLIPFFLCLLTLAAATPAHPKHGHKASPAKHAAHAQPRGLECWAAQSWSSSVCALCVEPTGNQCPAFGWTNCAPSSSQCQADLGGGETGECWAATSWSSGDCALCPDSRNGQCPAFSSTTCYGNKGECLKASSGGDFCADGVQCPSSTQGFRRPVFVGPHCYNSALGRGFGPKWKPSGKTHFEKYLPTVTDFYKLIQTVPTAVPILKSWQLDGCNAATAVYENFVCALELLESMNRTFEAPREGLQGARITEFANNGDEQADRRELAAFFSSKFKETGRLTVWEEANFYPDYIDAGNVQYPPTPGKSYHGRGPVQLSWNYNYGAFSEWFFGNKQILLDSPEAVDPEGPMGFIAALWFWFTPRDFTSFAPIAGRIRTRDAIVHWTDNKMNDIYRDGKDYDAIAGLGLATNVINGGIECATSWGESAAWRVGYYLTVASRFEVEIPDINNIAACRKDKYCWGFFSGCSATQNGTQCEARETGCGPSYSDGWNNNLCKWKLPNGRFFRLGDI